jgi:hypothetical protein
MPQKCGETQENNDGKPKFNRVRRCSSTHNALHRKIAVGSCSVSSKSNNINLLPKDHYTIVRLELKDEAGNLMTIWRLEHLLITVRIGVILVRETQKNKMKFAEYMHKERKTTRPFNKELELINSVI